MARLPTLPPEIQADFLREVAACQGGSPRWSAANMRRLLALAEPIGPQLVANAGASIGAAWSIESQGVVRLDVPRHPPADLDQTGRDWATYDPRTMRWETAGSAGCGLLGLLAWIWRDGDRAKFGQLDAATRLAKCFGLAVLHDRNRRAQQRDARLEDWCRLADAAEPLLEQTMHPDSGGPR